MTVIFIRTISETAFCIVDVFNEFLRGYIDNFKYQSITTDEFQSYLFSFFKSKVCQCCCSLYCISFNNGMLVARGRQSEGAGSGGRQWGQTVGAVSEVSQCDIRDVDLASQHGQREHCILNAWTLHKCICPFCCGSFPPSPSPYFLFRLPTYRHDYAGFSNSVANNAVPMTVANNFRCALMERPHFIVLWTVEDYQF